MSSYTEANLHTDRKNPTRFWVGFFVCIIDKRSSYTRLKGFQIHICRAADKEFGQKINAILNVL